MLIADEMGIAVEGIRSTEAESFSNLITLTVETPTGARTVAETYGDMPNVSIDHGVMEKASKKLGLEGQFFSTPTSIFASTRKMPRSFRPLGTRGSPTRIGPARS